MRSVVGGRGARPVRGWLPRAGVIVLAAVLALVPLPARQVERLYSNTLYPHLQRATTAVSNRLPFAVFDLLLLAALAFTLLVVTRAVREARRERRVAPLGRGLFRLASTTALVYVVFLSLWGLNYRRVPMQERLAMERATPTADQVLQLGRDAVQQLNALHDAAHAQGWATAEWQSPSLTAAFAAVQHRLTDAAPARPGRLKPTLLGPYFRWTGVDGMVHPFGLEVLANPDLLPFERPFVAAHEWAHLAGFADESEASFVGWLTCLGGSLPAQYSGWIFLYWQVSGDVSEAERAELWNGVAPGPRADVEAVIDRLRRGQLPTLRSASWLVYDQYLKANRVEEGVRSYGAVVTLILRARFDPGWVPVRR